MAEKTKQDLPAKNKQTLQIVLVMAGCFVVMIIGGIGISNAYDMGLKSPAKYSDFQKLLNRWGQDPKLQYLVAFYYLMSFGLWLLGGLGFLASLFSFIVSIFAFRQKKVDSDKNHNV
ncbi:hypothetical protein N8553_00700 [bacterium]|jgi:hypothetical protein|nr:hypothetical protein [Planctomicrobium sp.]MDA7503484.1 hypothetical protein [bacterium]